MSYFKFKNILDFEKKSIFLINFFLVVLVTTFFLFDWNLEYFFYFNIIMTFILSFFYFKRSKKLAKTLIVTNMFIFFYFLYPKLSYFLEALFGSESYIFIMFYNVLIAFLFLSFSGYKKTFLRDLKKFNFKVFLLILIIGLFYGFLFALIKEPVPSLFLDITNKGFLNIMTFLIFNSFIVAFSEQMIFSGFLFNVYEDLSSRFDAFFQTSILFVMFHLLRFKILISHYYTNFTSWFLLYISLYYIFLFCFMLSCLYFYSFKGKKYSGNFLYPVIIHFIADFSLFLFAMIRFS